MIKMGKTIQQLMINAEIVRALVQPISNEQANWKPDAQTWNMIEVMEHVYNEERIDFRKHLKEMFSNPPRPWETFRHEELISVESCQQALASFLKERQASLEWLQSLDAPDWEVQSQATFGPDEVLTFKAGDVLGSWVAHDFLHIRQMNELLYAWNVQQVSPYSVRYAGGW